MQFLFAWAFIEEWFWEGAHECLYKKCCFSHSFSQRGQTAWPDLPIPTKWCEFQILAISTQGKNTGMLSTFTLENHDLLMDIPWEEKEANLVQEITGKGLLTDYSQCSWQILNEWHQGFNSNTWQRKQL